MEQRPLPLSHFHDEFLTAREREVLGLLAQPQLTNREIAERLFLAPSSVKWYIRQIYNKLGANDRQSAITHARELGLIADPLPSQPTGHLPVQLTPFIGREKDIQKISQLLTGQQYRLITLTGSGGVGKTRLALKVAEIQQEQYPQGVWCVELSALLQDQFVSQRTAAVFQLPRNGAQDPLGLMKEYIGSASLLLILDNCEHLINACAAMVASLLQNCPHLQVIVTSREALGIWGERVYQVLPLQLPDLEEDPDIHRMAATESVQLFLSRAASVDPNFSITPRNKRAIAYICNRLDGIPLALELAAARLKVLEIEQIAEYLGSDFQILSGGSRTAPPRHQTIFASIDWSYNLLSPNEQRMLQKLSVFTGGWTLEAVKEVCRGETEAALVDTAVIDCLSQLIDKSLITFSHKKLPNPGKPGAGELLERPRYHMLEPIRQFARQKLRDNGDEAKLMDRHLSYYLSLAERAEPLFRGPDQMEWLNRLDAEVDNLRLALAWALETNPETELRLASALIWFWHIRGSWAEGLDWLCKGLRDPACPTVNNSPPNTTDAVPISEWVRAKSLSAAGFLQSNILIQQNDSKKLVQVYALLKESLSLYRRLRPQNRAGMAFTLLQLAQSATDQLHNKDVQSWANQSLALYREENDWFGISECLLTLANNERNPARAREAFDETILIKRRIKDIDGLAFTCADSSSLSIFEGAYDQAEAFLQESLQHFQDIGNQSYIARILNRMAWIKWIRAEPQTALTLLETALQICQIKRLTSALATNTLLRGEIQLSLERMESAELDIHRALVISKEHNHPVALATAYQLQGRIALLRGDYRSASKCLETALAINRATGSQFSAANLLYWYGRIKLALGDAQSGRSLFLECFEKYYGLRLWHHWLYLAYPLEALAEVALREQQIDQAVRFFANAHRLFPLIHNTLTPPERQEREHALQQLQAGLGAEAYAQSWQAELRKPLDQVIAFILNGEAAP